MRTVSERDRLTRQRWSLFLSAIVPSEVTVAKLDASRQDVTSNTGDGRALLYAQLKGKQTVGTRVAFDIGEALYRCGVLWSNGAAALYAAGYLSEFVGIIANLHRSETPPGEGLSPWFATLVPLAVDPSHSPTGYREAARSLLGDLKCVDHTSLRRAFERGSWHGIDSHLRAVAALDHRKGSKADSFFVTEAAVRTALREWALYAADAETRELLVEPLVEAEFERLRHTRSIKERPSIPTFGSLFTPERKERL